MRTLALVAVILASPACAQSVSPAAPSIESPREVEATAALNREIAARDAAATAAEARDEAAYAAAQARHAQEAADSASQRADAASTAAAAAAEAVRAAAQEASRLPSCPRDPRCTPQ